MSYMLLGWPDIYKKNIIAKQRGLCVCLQVFTSAVRFNNWAGVHKRLSV